MRQKVEQGKTLLVKGPALVSIVSGKIGVLGAILKRLSLAITDILLFNFF